MTSNRGGRIPPDGRPAQAKGVGKNAKRHDLERPKTPGYHGTDLQKGDVKAMEDGQRIAPASVQERGRAPEIATQARVRGEGVETSSMQIPDAIDFLGKRNGQGFTEPRPERRLDMSKATTWLPVLRRLASGPGASPALVSAFINQARLLAQQGAQPAVFVDMQAADDGIEAMLQEGMTSNDN